MLGSCAQIPVDADGTRLLDLLEGAHDIRPKQHMTSGRDEGSDVLAHDGTRAAPNARRWDGPSTASPSKVLNVLAV